MKMKDKLKGIAHDILAALLIGCIAGLALLLVFGLAGAAIGGGITSGLTAARSAIFVAASLYLLYAAGLLLKGGNLPEETFDLLVKRRDRRESQMDEAYRTGTAGGRGRSGQGDGSAENGCDENDSRQTEKGGFGGAVCAGMGRGEGDHDGSQHVPEILRIYGYVSKAYTVILSSAGMIMISMIPDMLLISMK